jgi:hypothetical protein
MHRRDFLKAMFAAAMAPAIVKAENIMRINSKILVPQGNVWINFETKEIHVKDTPVSVNELYQYLKDQWDNERHIVNAEYYLGQKEKDINGIHIREGFRITAPSLSKIHGGSIIQADELYTSLCSLGDAVLPSGGYSRFSV